MPRKARIDAPGALHHIIARGIGRRKIFNDDTDRQFFVDRLGLIIGETRTTCSDLKVLDKNRYCGHSVLMGRMTAQWQDTVNVTALFDDHLP